MRSRQGRIAPNLDFAPKCYMKQKASAYRCKRAFCDLKIRFRSGSVADPLGSLRRSLDHLVGWGRDTPLVISLDHQFHRWTKPRCTEVSFSSLIIPCVRIWRKDASCRLLSENSLSNDFARFNIKLLVFDRSSTCSNSAVLVSTFVDGMIKNRDGQISNQISVPIPNHKSLDKKK